VRPPQAATGAGTIEGAEVSGKEKAYTREEEPSHVAQQGRSFTRKKPLGEPGSHTPAMGRPIGDPIKFMIPKQELPHGFHTAYAQEACN
jgi:hypothetical protein